MSRYCPIIQGNTVYLNCQECDNQICEISESNCFYLLIAGTRTYADYKEFNAICEHMLSNVKIPVVIVSGGASGADAMAERYAIEKGYIKKVFKANWELYGNKAGYIRNEMMHDYIARFPKRGCLLFWNGVSRGTAHSFSLAKDRNTRLVVWNYKDKKYIEV